MLCGNGGFRAKHLKKSGVFGAMGKNCWYESTAAGFYGDNVNIATDVAILNHDIDSVMINKY